MVSVSHVAVGALNAAVPFGPPQVTSVLDVVLTRGSLVESRHRVHAAVVDADGGLRVAAGDPHVRTWWRSCAKPFQVLPTLERGVFSALGWGADELALACGSHGGEPEHVALARRMLSTLGLEAGDLACGPHEPLSARGVRLLRESGHPVTRLHNNCSGKHAAMLARAQSEGWPMAGYEQHGHPVQLAAWGAVSQWTGLPRHEIALAVDGCGVTVFGLPLTHMALAYARLVSQAAAGADGPRRIVEAMTTHAFLVGGSERFDSVLMDACKGRVICKIGAEGVHSLGLVDQRLGIAVKVEDGTPRAQYTAVLTLLGSLGALPDPLPASLQDLLYPDVHNTRGEIVGAITVGATPLGHSPSLTNADAS